MSHGFDPKIKKAVFRKYRQMEGDWIDPMIWFSKFREAKRNRRYKLWSQNKVCVFCKEETLNPNEIYPKRSPLRATLEHKVPLSKGGSESPKNTVIACVRCNSMKSNMDFEDFSEIVFDKISADNYRQELHYRKIKNKELRTKNIENGILTQSQVNICFSLILLKKYFELDKRILNVA